MPQSPIVRMRTRAQKQQKRLSEEEKMQRKEARESKGTGMSMWVVWFMIFVVVGSFFVQLYFTIVDSPKMMN